MMKLKLFGLFCLLPLVASTILAQEDPREVLKNLNYEQQQQLQKQITSYKFSQEELNESAERFGVERDSRHILRMMGKYPKNSWNQELAEPKVFGHIQGKTGIDYPSPDSIKKTYRRFELDKEAVRKYVREEYLPQLKEQVIKMEQAVPLPNCSESKTIRKNISKTNNQSGNAPVQDLLFIGPEKAPKDQDIMEFLGKKVTVLVYYPNKKTEIHRVAKGLAVDCLPMRFRTTTEAFFIDRGINALKNYDEDYHASGILHPYFK